MPGLLFFAPLSSLNDTPPWRPFFNQPCEKEKKKKKKPHINCSRGNLTYSPPVSWWQSQNSEKPVLWSVLSLCTREERAQSKDKEQTRQVTYPLRDSSTCHVIHLKIMEQWESERQLLSSLVKPLCSWQSRKKTLPSWALEKSTKYRLYVLNYNRAPLGCWAHNRVNRRVGSCPTVPHINQRQYLTFKCVLRTCCCLATRGECIRKPREQTRYKPWQKKKEEKKKKPSQWTDTFHAFIVPKAVTSICWVLTRCN